VWYFVQSATFASFQHIFWLSLYMCWANFDFSSRASVKLYFCSIMLASKVQFFFTDLTFAANTWDIVHALYRLLEIFN
jgi:hypothetical protein